MMIDTIHITWKPDWTNKRFCLGKITRQTDGYLADFDESQLRINNIDSVDFGSNIIDKLKNKAHQEVLMHDLLLRIPSTKRSDGKFLLEFWQADRKEYDDFDRLGFTQGIRANDDFEFLAEFPAEKGIRFVTNLSYLQKHSFEDLTIGTELKYKFESDNQFDSNAVAVINPKTRKPIGYVKTYHNLFFHECVKRKLTPTIRVHKLLEYDPKLEIYIIVSL